MWARGSRRARRARGRGGHAARLGTRGPAQRGAHRGPARRGAARSPGRAGASALAATIVARMDPRTTLQVGEQARVQVDLAALHFFDPETGTSLRG